MPMSQGTSWQENGMVVSVDARESHVNREKMSTLAEVSRSDTMIDDGWLAKESENEHFVPSDFQQKSLPMVSAGLQPSEKGVNGRLPPVDPEKMSGRPEVSSLDTDSDLLAKKSEREHARPSDVGQKALPMVPDGFQPSGNRDAQTSRVDREKILTWVEVLPSDMDENRLVKEREHAEHSGPSDLGQKTLPTLVGSEKLLTRVEVSLSDIESIKERRQKGSSLSNVQKMLPTVSDALEPSDDSPQRLPLMKRQNTRAEKTLTMIDQVPNNVQVLPVPLALASQEKEPRKKDSGDSQAGNHQNTPVPETRDIVQRLEGPLISIHERQPRKKDSEVVERGMPGGPEGVQPPDLAEENRHPRKNVTETSGHMQSRVAGRASSMEAQLDIQCSDVIQSGVDTHQGVLEFRARTTQDGEMSRTAGKTAGVVVDGRPSKVSHEILPRKKNHEGRCDMQPTDFVGERQPRKQATTF
ncbi:hypothetical protein JVU11DRAFT_6018 [Chiua virens]|nr:hypothetical protein JVU11DRAFT_6018 [Chiua virens]